MTPKSQTNISIGTDNPRGGLTLTFDLTSGEPIQESPTWRVANRTLKLVRLGPGASLTINPVNCFVKVILGQLANINRSCLAAPFTTRSTQVFEDTLVAGHKGALFALLQVDQDAAPIVHMNQVQFEGPLAEHLVWRSFEEKFGEFIDTFNGHDCHMMDGIQVQDQNSDEVVYINFWTCGKGVDLSTHNHAQAPSPAAPAFTEVHWVLHSGTTTGGMYETAAPDAPDRVRHPMGLGDEHGPYYDLDHQGLPKFRENGAVQYPWHGWQGGDDNSPEQRYDFVAAFEINPNYIEPART